MKVILDKDIKGNALKGVKVAIIGYGSPGHAHALNLHESGVDVKVGLLESSNSRKKAAKAVYEKSIAPHARKDATLAFAHGFSIHFGQIVPADSMDVIMIAPKGPGHLVRHEYTQGRGVPSLIAIHQDVSGKAKEKAMAYAGGIGAGRVGILETSFREETETDLFGEQAVLCGGATGLVLAGFETLVEAGYAPEMAYFECLHELKLIVDLMYQGGISNMRYSISNTAEYGDLTRGERIVNEDVKDEMRYILEEIQSGEFAKEWILENQAGRPVFNALKRRGAEHPIEEVGKRLRALMPWLKEESAVKD